MAVFLLTIQVLTATFASAEYYADPGYDVDLVQTYYTEDDEYLELTIDFPEGEDLLFLTNVYNDEDMVVTDYNDPLGVEIYNWDTSPQTVQIPIKSEFDCYDGGYNYCWYTDDTHPADGTYGVMVQVFRWSDGEWAYEEDEVFYDDDSLLFIYDGLGIESGPTCGDDICDSGETCEEDSCCSGVEKWLDTDEYNCGTCGNICDLDQVCEGGECVEYVVCGDSLCGAGETCAADNCCDGDYTDLENDELNCGWCGNVCGDDETCEDDMCRDTNAGSFTFNEALDELPCGDDCERAQTCLVSLSAKQGCAAEVADIFPVIDKHTAVVLLADDVCDLKHRLIDNWDVLGAGVTAVLALIDFADNIPDVISPAGYVISVPIDVVEGAVDCFEAIVYEYLDECGGYTWCVATLMKEVAIRGYEASRDVAEYAWSFVWSPATIGVVNDNGDELGVDDGVFVFEFGDFKAVMVRDPDEFSGGYNLELNGTGSGTYDVQTIVFDGDGEQVADVTVEDVPVSSGQQDFYEVNIPSNASSSNVTMAETTVGSSGSSNIGFTDLSLGSHWSFDYVSTLVGRGVISGYLDGSFKPENDITRAEVLKIAMEAFYLSESDYGWEEYLDIEATDWYVGYVGGAFNYGVIEIEDSRYFRPNEKATRVESLDVILTAASLSLFEQGKILDFWSVPTVEASPDFSDVDIYAEYASLVDTAVVYGFIHPDGYVDNTFRPDNPITRAEISKITVLIQDFFEEHAE